MVEFPLQGGDPLLPAVLGNFSKNKRLEVLAYLDTGADVAALPKDVWEELGLEAAGIVAIGAVGGVVRTYYSYIDVELLGKTFKDAVVVYQEYGDILIGKEILGGFDYCIRNSNGVLEIRSFRVRAQVLTSTS